jgi:CubicO group peptidase (beta-lactamase class C family)
MILNKGMFKGKRILSENAIAQMQQAQTTPTMIKYTPKAGEGYNYGLGEWLLEQDANGKGICVASPGLFGTWPMVDNCRGYAAIIFVKTLLAGEQKKEVYMDIKSSIDEVLPCSK